MNNELNDEMNETNVYIAHYREDGTPQTVREHSENTARLCSEYAIPALKNICYNIGLLHDIGKYQPLFQRKIRGEKVSVEHSICGAIAVCKGKPKDPAGLLSAACIAGHHGGLPDCGTKADEPADPTLFGRLKRACGDYSTYLRELDIPDTTDTSCLMNLLKTDCNRRSELVERFAFLTRYCFSCLTDADTVDTMTACGNEPPEPLTADFEACLALLNKKTESFRNITELQKARSRLQRQAYENIREKAEIYLMNMPTGSGKTIAGMKCALLRALDSGKKRIIYVIPYNSIIDQTVAVFEDMFRGKARILRHQSSFSYEEEENIDEDYRKSAIFACENWNAQIIVTTAVQFFETLYSCRRGKLRKMHNMADSVLVFDEAHLMPAQYLQSCLLGISYVTKLLNSEAIFLTATMPDFESLLRQYAVKNILVRNLIPERTDFKFFRKNRYVFLGEISDLALLHSAAEHASALIVVNSRKTARRLYESCPGEKYHLSTYMTGKDRADTIQRIRERLGDLREEYPDGNVPEDRRVTVISTSLIEAGVDLDFDSAYRELNGLDNVLQTGGRCNREGLKETADVYIFELEDRRCTHTPEQNILSGVIAEFEDISSPVAVKTYYERLFRVKRDEIVKKSLGSMCNSIDSIPFNSYSDSFKMIDSPSVSIAVPCDETGAELIGSMQSVQNGKKMDVRKLQKYCCSVTKNDFAQLLSQGVADDYGTGMYVLTNPDYYSHETGILFESTDYFIE